MSNRHVEELSRVYEAVFRDLSYAYPALTAEFDRDQARLQRALKQRGLHAPCVDLPALGKHLDRCLSEGEYIPSGLPLGRRMSKGVPIPKFLGGLYLLVFELSGALKGDADVTAIDCLRQVLYLAKAAELDCSPSEVCAEVRSFAEVDANLPIPESFWSSEEPVREEIEETYRGFAESQLYSDRVRELKPDKVSVLSTFLRTLDVVSSVLSTTLGPYLYGEWRFRHGPGAIAEVVGPTNKYSWFSWPNRLQSAFPLDDCGFHSVLEWCDHALEASDTVEPSSRLISVRKTYTKPRLIAAEPCAHQWCQQNIWHYIRVRVKESWIGDFLWFNDQTRNQRLCLLGSRDGSLATVDLSAASDRVTCHAVGQLFRRNPGLLLALQASRTRFVDQKLAHDVPNRIELKKFSTMGSACTFPVETLLFFCVAVSAVLTKRQMRPTLKEIRSLTEQVTVFGDDIIVPEDCRELLTDALEVLHFKVNTAKTFGTGRFRESCGVDAFRGTDVTPAKWKGICSGSPEAYASTLEVTNNFYSKFFVATSAYLDSTLRRGRFNFPLIPMRSGYLGRKSFVDPGPPSAPKARWNADLQRKEFWLPTFLTKVARTAIEDGSSLLQYFTEVPESALNRATPFGVFGLSHELWTRTVYEPSLTPEMGRLSVRWVFPSFQHGYADYPVLKIKHRWVPIDTLRP